MKKQVSFLILLFSVETLWAAGGGGHHGPLEVPEVVLFQVINATIFFGGLFLILRKPVKSFFSSRYTSFNEARDKGQKVLKEAQSNHAKVVKQLEEFEARSNENLEKAKQEAQEIRQKIHKEAETISEKIKSESFKARDREVSIAKDVLRREMSKKAVEMAEASLSGDLSEESKRSLQSDFSGRVEGVRA